MSVWPSNFAGSLALETSEGALISISVSVEPRLLEELLEALAQVQFPINPQIYHDAALRYVFADGREEVIRTTLVEFPAYAGRLSEIRNVLEAYGFPPDSLQVTSMLDEMHTGGAVEYPSAQTASARVFRIRHASAAVTH